MVISPPTVARGVVAFTTYAPGTNGCNYGESYTYAMNSESCANASLPSGARPTPASIIPGIATSQYFGRFSNILRTESSKGLAAAVSLDNARGLGPKQVTLRGPRPLYWRTEGTSP